MLHSILILVFAVLLGFSSAAFSQAEHSADEHKLQALLANKSQPLTWVFTGDSITHGAKHTGGNRSYVEHFAERIRWEMGRPNDIVINTGISGDKADGILRSFDWRVARFRPQVVSIMIGMNDSTRGEEKRGEFQNNLRTLIERVRAVGAIPILHTMNAVEPSASKERGNLPAYVQVIIEVAAQEKAFLVNHWEHWKTTADSPEELRKWLNDPIHPNGRGHRELAIRIFHTFGIFDPKSPTCQPTAP